MKYAALLVALALAGCRDSGYRCASSHTDIMLMPQMQVCGKDCFTTIMVPMPIETCDVWVCVKPEICGGKS